MIDLRTTSDEEIEALITNEIKEHFVLTEFNDTRGRTNIHNHLRKLLPDDLVRALIQIDHKNNPPAVIDSNQLHIDYYFRRTDEDEYWTRIALVVTGEDIDSTIAKQVDA